MPAGPDFRYTNFSGGRGCPHFTYTHFSGYRHRRSLATQTFRVAVTVAFYLHKLFGWSGFCILPTHTFDHAARPFLKKSNEIHKKSLFYIENVFALRAPFYEEIHKKISYSSIRNCRRSTLIQNGTQNGGGTLKNCKTLISTAACRDVCDAYFRRCLFSVFAVLLINIKARAARKIFWCRFCLDAEKVCDA